MNGGETTGRLDGQSVALTGRLVALTRAEAAALVHARGGRCVHGLTVRTSLLVVGQDGWPLRKDGRLSRKLQQARLLIAGGAALRIVSEEEFLESLDLQEARAAVCRRYTLLQLNRILNVPHGRLRAWLRADLIRPVEAAQGVMYFDYAAVARIKALCDLIESGVSLARLRRSLRRLQQWLPRSDDLLQQLDRVAGKGRLVFRLADGRLAEPHGQLVFDFEPHEEPAAAFDPRGTAPLSADALFEQALTHEDAGRHAEAAAIYCHWLETFGPEPGVCFNLGNSLLASGDTEGAAAALREAVRLDPRFVAAWNNLGQTLARQGESAAALRAMTRAVRLDPGFADGHYNLAELLDRLGRPEQARIHWRAYLQFDTTSPWAEHARRRLGDDVIPI